MEGFLQKKDEFADILARWKKGDPKAPDEIFSYWSPKLYRFFMARTSLDRDVSEDLTQAVFMKVVTNLDRFDPGQGIFAGWIWAIARNALIDHYREKKSVHFSEIEEAGGDIADHRLDMHRDARASEMMRFVKELTEEEQELFSLRHLSGFSYEELADMLQKSETALRVSIHRINKKLRDATTDV